MWRHMLTAPRQPRISCEMGVPNPIVDGRSNRIRDFKGLSTVYAKENHHRCGGIVEPPMVFLAMDSQHFYKRVHPRIK